MAAHGGFFYRLSNSLSKSPVALMTVVSAEGSTPRIAGARQFLTAEGESWGSVGGGVAESRAMELAHETLADGRSRTFQVDLRGKPEDVRDGVCGGVMTLWITHLDKNDSAVIHSLEQSLRAGKRVLLSTQRDGETPLILPETENTSCLEEGCFEEMIEPAPHLLIVGAGHIGRALAQLACELDFVVSVQDSREQWLLPAAFPAGCRLELTLETALEPLRCWEGARFITLVTRGFAQDVEALNVLKQIPDLDYLGILGSRRRVETVLREQNTANAMVWPEDVVHAPIGIEIGAETPAEIAVSIAAEMIRVMRQEQTTAMA
jgi:xanthine dehydrogenase accessory factor